VLVYVTVDAITSAIGGEPVSSADTVTLSMYVICVAIYGRADGGGC
jgi:hypothetical protein